MSLTFVLGGARSGKTSYALREAWKRSGNRHVMIATAQAHDAEMADRIARHRAERGEGWVTVEAPLDLAGAVAALGAGDVAVVDCLTLWLTNHLLVEADLGQQVADLTRALAASPAALYVVSNEVGQGIVPDNALARRFRDEAGWMNQAVAAAADRAVLVAAGLPLVLKG
ncbi:bifunctional adenosylcobinamide kinase/adenosylcobinamide-phosphate guanylyltransferase [Phenylobacterium sp. 58.2.17]|uniref:bifunctional adenosylcobinamide kinase/adenosylcobinamide-phosphate guanylyltransferase n=1 Tax=Phenylobacterium sp. 58.2.17 TaxID=2969306 RepID=UPI0022650EC9|nr:bifunctional adenosylcobinamide kinase/adenosylcobinamide-phosphate guanylyltransferase [Phenylobacterium sp. 58.2.17]MCX7586283.1 bifunctional adenosylcobinamide kinase/adenosylcobinamide-phosphate guanylyltransferase [Phenylobacterium sp. 58.2.17]